MNILPNRFHKFLSALHHTPGVPSVCWGRRKSHLTLYWKSGSPPTAVCKISERSRPSDLPHPTTHTHRNTHGTKRAWRWGTKHVNPLTKIFCSQLHKVFSFDLKKQKQNTLIRNNSGGKLFQCLGLRGWHEQHLSSSHTQTLFFNSIILYNVLSAT